MANSSLDLSSNVYIFSLFCLISKHGTESSGYIRTKREREESTDKRERGIEGERKRYRNEKDKQNAKLKLD